MRLSVGLAGAFVVLLHTLTLISCYRTDPQTAKDMLTQNLCICPCGNPKGGKLYVVPNTEKLNWFDAVAHCSSLGMSIVAIEDAGQRELFRKFLVENRYNRRVQYWIGANTLSPGRGLRWDLTEREVRNPEWVNGGAPSFGPSEPFCVSMYADSMKWVGSDCEAERKHVICEY
uniref:C-type lectin domain-containing protein n=1 Tax=Anopheles atroparvus TaxID=41427 RepID=A0A182JFY9_ANOAO